MQFSKSLYLKWVSPSMQVFLNVWLAAPQAQGSLRKVLRTWNGIFPEAMLATVARQIGSPPVGFPITIPHYLFWPTARLILNSVVVHDNHLIWLCGAASGSACLRADT